MAITKYPIRVPEGDSIRVLNNEAEERAYLQERYVEGHKNPALMGQPVPNYTFPLSEDDVKSFNRQRN